MTSPKRRRRVADASAGAEAAPKLQKLDSCTQPDDGPTDHSHPALSAPPALTNPIFSTAAAAAINAIVASLSSSSSSSSSSTPSASSPGSDGQSNGTSNEGGGEADNNDHNDDDSNSGSDSHSNDDDGDDDDDDDDDDNNDGTNPHPGDTAHDTDDDTDDDPDADFAFESSLRADLAAGLSLPDAVRSLFGGLDDDDNDAAEARTANARRLRALNLASPVLAALRSDASLQTDVAAVAALCRTIYTLAESTIRSLRSERPPRARLPRAALRRGLRDVVALVAAARQVVVLAGAGLSVACGIPDFRSAGGLYDTIARRYRLPDPQLVFDLAEFRDDPALFYSFARHVMPADSVRPSAAHRFLADLDRRGRLLRVYSQNIDGLERRAGVSPDRLVLCHGSFLSGTCMSKRCGARFDAKDFVEDVKKGTIPRCPRCEEQSNSKLADNSDDDDEDDDDDADAAEGVIKPDIVFFGEKLPKRVEECLKNDVEKADLVVVLGTSLKVQPVARIPRLFDDSVARVLINRELVQYEFDVELMGNCDDVMRHLRKGLGWNDDDASAQDEAERVEAAEEEGKQGNKKAKVEAVAKVDGEAEVIEDEDHVEFVAPRRILFKGAKLKLREVDEEEEVEEEGADMRGGKGREGGRLVGNKRRREEEVDDVKEGGVTVEEDDAAG